MTESSSMPRQGPPELVAAGSVLPNVGYESPEPADRRMLGTVGVRLEQELPKLVLVDLDAEAGAVRDGAPSSG